MSAEESSPPPLVQTLNRYKCLKCGQDFKYAKSFKKHMLRMTPCIVITGLYYYECQYDKIKNMNLTTDIIRDAKIIKEINKLLLFYRNLSDIEQAKVETMHNEVLDLVDTFESHLHFNSQQSDTDVGQS